MAGKDRAWNELMAAIRSRKLIRPGTCERCGREPGAEFPRLRKQWREIHAVIRDYASPLDVDWLCKWCRDGTYRERMTTMATSLARPTFAQWLGKQLTRHDTDPVGWLARLWKTREGPDRPKVSSPTGIVKYLKTLNDDSEWLGFLDQAVQAATQVYTAEVQAKAVADRQPDAQPGHLTGPPAAGPGDLAGQLADGDTGPAGTGGQGHVMDIMDLTPPPHDELHASPQEVSWLADLLMQIQAQLGLVMQMLAVSNPAAAEILLSQLAEDAATAGGPGSDQVTDGQARAQHIAMANGWLPADQPPTPSGAPAGGFEAWWGAADPAAGEGDG